MPLNNHPLTVYVVGPTNAGKSTFLATAAGTYPQTVGLVEVGKILRAKYPPDYFKGLNNPKHTALEAWEIFEGEWARHCKDGKSVILVDGQPRDQQQLDAVLTRHELGERQIFLHLWAPNDVRVKRAHERDGSDPAKLALSQARLISDEPSNYDILARLLWQGVLIVGTNTASPGYRFESTYAHLMALGKTL
jgi:energy-coupling factor transporter ATP-binding protein EcfA2